MAACSSCPTPAVNCPVLLRKQSCAVEPLGEQYKPTCSGQALQSCCALCKAPAWSQSTLDARRSMQVDAREPALQRHDLFDILYA